MCYFQISFPLSNSRQTDEREGEREREGDRERKGEKGRGREKEVVLGDNERANDGRVRLLLCRRGVHDPTERSTMAHIHGQSQRSKRRYSGVGVLSNIVNLAATPKRYVKPDCTLVAMAGKTFLFFLVKRLMD